MGWMALFGVVVSALLALATAVCGASPWRGSAATDWLVGAAGSPATATRDSDTVVLTNGLLTRVFTLAPCFGVVDLVLNATLEQGGTQSMLRAIAPDTTVQLDDVVYSIGGLRQASKYLAFLNRTDVSLTCDAAAFVYASHAVSAPIAPFPWVPGTRGSPAELAWPPKGVHLAVKFRAPPHSPPAHQNVTVVLHYELYDGAPLLAKWVECASAGGAARVTAVTVEALSAAAPFGPHLTHGSFPPGSWYNGAPAESSAASPPLLLAMTDMAHGAACDWVDDYASSAEPGGLHDQGAVEPALNCSYTSGPGVRVSPDAPFVSFRVFLLACDSPELQRQSLSRQRVVQLLAPHTTENPIFFHATDVSDSGFKTAVDQMAAVGFEMLVLSFGSGFALENADPTYVRRIHDQVQYARARGIEVGGYDLICLQRGHGGYGGNVGDQWAAVGRDGQPGPDACFASGWYDKLYGLATHFINATGLSILETDGPYGGGACASTTHAHHTGAADSVYHQTRKQGEFFHALRSLGVYVNQPDNFFFQGGSRTGMGYDENQYSLPRWRDLTISRAGMYDDLYMHTPTQGWMFVPIDVYHAGGAAAAFAPLADHLQAYEWALAQYLGAGVAACYRGRTLFDTPATRDVVARWVAFYKAHRRTLISPIVHLRRASLQDWDGWLHVNPHGHGSGGREVGLAMLFNPTDAELDTTVRLPLYYTGLADAAFVSVDGASAVRMALDRSFSIRLPMRMPPRSIHTVVVERPQQDDTLLSSSA